MRDWILHLADLHLGAPVSARLQSLNPSLHEAFQRSRGGLLGRLAAWIADPLNRVGLVLIAGDLFHSYRPDESLAADVRTALAQIAAVVPVITVPGNHDEYSYADCVYRQGRWPGILVTGTEPAEVWRSEWPEAGSLSVWSAAYVAGSVPPGSQLKFPPVSSPGVAMAHATLSDHFPGLADRCFRLGHDQVAAAGYRYLAVGHIHTPRRWTLGRCEAVYPGPPVGPSPSDPGSAALTAVELRAGAAQLHRIEDASLLGHRWVCRRVRVEPGEKPQQVAQRCLTALPDDPRQIAVLLLEGSVESEDVAAQLQQLLLEEGRTAVLDSAEVTLAPPPDLETLLREQTLAGEFARAWRDWQQQAGPEANYATRVLYEGLEALRQGG